MQRETTQKKDVKKPHRVFWEKSRHKSRFGDRVVLKANGGVGGRSQFNEFCDGIATVRAAQGMRVAFLLSAILAASSAFSVSPPQSASASLKLRMATQAAPPQKLEVDLHGRGSELIE